MTVVPLTDPCLLLAPYVWKLTGSGAAARAEATMPGAYLRSTVRGTAVVDLLVDGTANADCPPPSLPIVDVSVNGGAFTSSRLVADDSVYPLRLAQGLGAGAPHVVEVFFRSARLDATRWTDSRNHLRVAGLLVEGGGSLLPCPRLPGNALAFGDSITEGVCVEGLCPFYSNLPMNNARVTWAPLVCTALRCEYGQLGTGGQGMVRPIEMPPLPQTWHRYDAGATRLVNGMLAPQPDLVLCCMGTNDYEEQSGKAVPLDITAAYAAWLEAVRRACPAAQVMSVVPPLGWHAQEIAAAVESRTKAGDRGVHLIDTTPLRDKFGVVGATQLALDGVHPSIHGNAVLATLIAAEAARIMDAGGRRRHA